MKKQALIEDGFCHPAFWICSFGRLDGDLIPSSRRLMETKHQMMSILDTVGYGYQRDGGQGSECDE